MTSVSEKHTVSIFRAEVAVVGNVALGSKKVQVALKMGTVCFSETLVSTY
jgi:hypothetical protein